MSGASILLNALVALGLLFVEFGQRRGLQLLGRRFGRRRRIELRPQRHHQSTLFVRLHAHQQLVLREVEELLEFLEPVFLRLESFVFAANPALQVFRQGAGIHLQPVRLQHVAQQWQRLLRLVRRLLLLRRALPLDHVAPLRSGHIHVIGVLHLLHELREAPRSVRLLRERGVQLQHRRFQQPELRRHFAPVQHLQRPFDQRHGLR